MTKSKIQILWDRDGGRCWICGEPVPEPGTLAHDDPDQATRDHVLQRRKGGTNGTNNLRLAHQRCNQGRETPPIDAPIHHALPRAWHHHLAGLPDGDPVDLDELLTITFELLDMPRPRPIPPEATIGTRPVKPPELHPIETARAYVDRRNPGEVATDLVELLGEALTVHAANTTVGTLRRLQDAGNAASHKTLVPRLRTTLHCARILTQRGATTDDIQLWLVHHADAITSAPIDQLRKLEPGNPGLRERLLHAAHTQNLN